MQNISRHFTQIDHLQLRLLKYTHLLKKSQVQNPTSIMVQNQECMELAYLLKPPCTSFPTKIRLISYFCML